jgi:ankyrin repeat protein
MTPVSVCRRPFLVGGSFLFLLIIVSIWGTGCGKKNPESGQSARAQLNALQLNFNTTVFLQEVEKGSSATVELFLQAGQNPNVEIPIPHEPEGKKRVIHRAIELGNAAIVARLIQAGADMRAKILSLQERINGMTPAFYTLLLKDYPCLQAMVKNRVDFNGSMKYDFKNETITVSPLIFALYHLNGDLDFTRLLLVGGADVNARGMIDRGREGHFFNALSWAIVRKRIDLVKLFLEFKADTTAKVQEGSTSKTLFDLAEKAKSDEILALLQNAEKPPPSVIPVWVWVVVAISITIGLLVFFVPSLFRKKATGSPAILGEALQLMSHAHLAKRIAGLQLLMTNFQTIEDKLVLGRAVELCHDDDPGVQFWAKKVRMKFAPTSEADKPAAGKKPVPTASKPKTLPEFMERLRNTKGCFLCQELIRQILELKAPQTRAALLAYLQEVQDPMILSFLVKKLGQEFRDPALIVHLKPLLAHADERVVANTLEGIEALHVKESIVIFAQMLNHESHRVRANAAKAINTYDQEVSRTIFTQMLGMEERPHFIIAACKAIRETKDVYFLPALVHVGTNPLITADALETIQTLGGKDLLEAFHQKMAVHPDPEKTAGLIESIGFCLERLPQLPGDGFVEGAPGTAPTTDSPTVDAPATETMTADSPTVDAPAAETMTADSPTVDAPAAETMTADSPTAAITTDAATPPPEELVVQATNLQDSPEGQDASESQASSGSEPLPPSESTEPPRPPLPTGGFDEPSAPKN